MAKYSIARARARSQAALARARGFAGARTGIRTGVGYSVGALGAGVIDAKMGEGTSTTLGAIGVLGGYFFKMPDAMNAGLGLLSPMLYRQGLTLGAKYLTSSAPA